MDWNELIQDLMYAVITTALPVITYYIAIFLDEFFKKISVETEETVFSNTINEALNLVLSVVLSTSQTYVDKLKEAGNFSEEAKKEAFEITKSTILNLMSEKMKEIIATAYGDISAWLDIQIEAAVRETKVDTINGSEKVGE